VYKLINDKSHVQPYSIIVSTQTYHHLHYAYFISALFKPDPNESYFDCMKELYQNTFKAATKIQFNKNRKVVVFSISFSRAELGKVVKSI
jgi:hypothetical protein